MNVIMRATLPDRAPNTYYGHWLALRAPKSLTKFAGHCPLGARRERRIRGL
jgi:hypothetical protein